MLNMTNFEAGQAIRNDLIQLLMPIFTVKYSNAMNISALEEETVFQVDETFEIVVEWQAHIENLEDPIVVGIVKHELCNTIDLKAFLDLLPDAPDAESLEAIKRARMRIREAHKNYANQEGSTDVDALREDYNARVNRFKKMMFKSKTDDTLGLLNKSPKTVSGEGFDNLLKLTEFLETDYKVVIDKQAKLALLRKPILEEDDDDYHQTPMGSIHDAFGLDVVETEHPLGDMKSEASSEG